MAKERMSPEEKLLALIKGEKKEVVSRQPSAVSEKKEKSRNDPISEGAGPKKPDYASEIFKAYLSGNKLFDPAFLRSLNRYLVVVSIILIAYFVFDILFVRPYKNIYDVHLVGVQHAAHLRGVHYGLPSAAARPVEQKKKEFLVRLKDYSYYSGQISGKKIFASVAGEEAAAGGAKPDITEEIAKDIGLVGIIPGADPQAIIEDRKSQKTYYLTKGQSFDNFTLDEIGEGKVILEYNGKKIALFL